VGLATQAMLWEVGVQTVLPPGYLCCGYPQRGAGQYDKAEKMMTDNRVLFHRMANTLNYLDIKTVVVSCGTCYDQLAPMSSTRSSRLPHHRHPRISAGEGVKLEGVTGTRYMYHEPCHTPMKLQDPTKTVNSLIQTRQRQDREERPLLRRVGHAGGARPDISTQVRFRKEEEVIKGADKLRADGFDGDVKILTSCPACLGACRATAKMPAPRPTTSWWKSPSTCWARTGCRNT
jgi:Fe-S oxidoreductase